jgi:hypothetical protein
LLAAIVIAPCVIPDLPGLLPVSMPTHAGCLFL